MLDDFLLDLAVAYECLWWVLRLYSLPSRLGLYL